MRELLSATAAWLPVTWIPVVLVLLAPTASPRRRVAFAVILGTMAAGAALYAGTRIGAPAALDVINPFIDPDRGRPVAFVVDQVRAPGWAWPLALAIVLAIPALALVVLRQRPAAPPCPVTFAMILTTWTFLARLGLEKAAAPEGLTWSIGVTMPLVLLLPFVGWWSGSSGFSFKKLLLVLLLIAAGQRGLIIAGSLLATTLQLGTHLDVTAIREVTLPLGHREFPGEDESWRQWWTLMVIPQTVLWIPITMGLGLLTATVPYAIGRREPAT